LAYFAWALHMPARNPKCHDCGLKPVCLFFQGKVKVA
jgi:hypothetical protein